MTTELYDANNSLDTLNTLIAQQEGDLEGPLTKIGNSNGQTSLEFDTLAGVPAKRAVLTIGKPPANSTTIGAGKIYISGTLTSATAYRPN